MIRTALRSTLDAVRWLTSRLVNPFDPPVVVLIYHRVTSLPRDPQLLAVKPENFRAQMRYLREHFPVLRFDEEWQRPREPSVVVTFDDGYADNFLEALPILAQEQVPATFFVTTGAIGTSREFWWDELERVLLCGAPLPAQCSLRLAGKGRSWQTANAAQLRRCYDELHPLLRRLPTPARDAALDTLRSWAGVAPEGRGSHRPLAEDELRRLSQSPWAAVGAHCVTHPRLSALPEEEQRREIAGSRERLEEICGRKISVFSYPFGCRGDYDRASLKICREAGFRRVAANFPGQAHRWSDPLQIPRQLVRDWPLEIFKAKLDGFFTV